MHSSEEVFRSPRGTQTRWASFENPTASKGAAAKTNRGAKGAAFLKFEPGMMVTLFDIAGSGMIRRIWITVAHRHLAAMRSFRIDMYWDGATTPAVSAPLGDFFGVGAGQRVPFLSELFSDPEGRSFNCFIPMPFRKSARITVTNESPDISTHLYYDINALMNIAHGDDVLYFHAHWRRERPNALGKDFTILPQVHGTGRFLGCNVGIITDPAYAGSWWGEGEFKAWIDGDGDDTPTLCGTGSEDYTGTGWGLGVFNHPTQGCLVANSERGVWAFYRYHTVDPIYFDHDCRVSIQTIGGTGEAAVAGMLEKGVELIPVTIDIGAKINWLLDHANPLTVADPNRAHGFCNFYRCDDRSATAYFYLDRPENRLPALAPVEERTADLVDLTTP